MMGDYLLSTLDNWPYTPLIDNICLFCGIADRERFSWFCSDFCEAEYASDKANQLNLCEMLK